MKGILITNHDGEINVSEIDLPIETHGALLAWALDMVRAINAHTEFRKWLIRLALGRYAYRELVGVRDTIETYGYYTTHEYNLRGMEYHKDKVRL